MRGIWVAVAVALVGCSSTPEKKSNPLFEPPSGNAFESGFYDAPKGGPKEGMPPVYADIERKK